LDIRQILQVFQANHSVFSAQNAPLGAKKPTPEFLDLKKHKLSIRVIRLLNFDELNIVFLLYFCDTGKTGRLYFLC
jgi:hypothetical protein